MQFSATAHEQIFPLVGVAVAFACTVLLRTLLTLSSTVCFSQYRFNPADIPSLWEGLATGRKTYGLLTVLASRFSDRLVPSVVCAGFNLSDPAGTCAQERHTLDTILYNGRDHFDTNNSLISRKTLARRRDANLLRLHFHLRRLRKSSTLGMLRVSNLYGHFARAPEQNRDLLISFPLNLVDFRWVKC